ncbi:MAG: peptide chain release factor N(5)-glutamine methyltransferase [Verrucomicrobiota bacterium]
MDILKQVGLLEQRFSAAGVDNAKRVAEELVAHILECKPLEIYLRNEPLPPEALLALEQLSGRIEAGEPLQYVVGHVDFRGLEIKCDPRALIPRPETEMLVEEVLDSQVWQVGLDRRASRPTEGKQDGRLGEPSLPSPRIIDIGTGSGCIILALAKERPDADFTAVDISSAALELAQENARIQGLENKIHWKENHLLSGFAPESFDAIVANLPYISTGDWKALSPAVRDHEPQSALDSGPSGMELIEELAIQARTVLNPGGMLFLEYGYDQGNTVSECLKSSGYLNIQIKQDIADLDRIAIAENP